MELYLIGIAVFIAVVLLIEGIAYFIRSLDRWNPERERVRAELTSLSKETYERTIDITRKRRPLSDIPWLNDLLSRVPFLYRIDRMLLQADSKQPLGVVLLTSLVLGMAAFMACQLFLMNLLLALLMGPLFGMAPLLYVHLKKIRRMRKFEQQLPDALSLIARALRAGHAFSGGLQMVSQEFEDPIGGEFEKMLKEINFGIGMDEALANLNERIDCNDLKFFAVSIIIQKETGGNLAEILENIAHLIRERFKFFGRVRSLSAEGRLSAYILIAIPFFFALLLSIMNPTFLRVLATDPIGRTLVAIGLVMMVIGVVIMRKMVNIKV
jgi:tight adherence protein B